MGVRSSSFTWSSERALLPRNPEAGDTPAPATELEQRVVDLSARVMWRAFPYFAWRYGDWGRAFGRSDRLFALAAGLRSRRTGALSESTFAACETLCFAAASGVRRRRGIGRLIAAAVADRATGMGEHDEALIRWLVTADPQDLTWREGCRAAREHAQQNLRRPPGGLE